MKMSELIIVLLLSVFSMPTYSQIEIKLHLGREYTGIVVNNSKDSITINTFKNRLISFSKKEIENIEPLTSTIRLINGKILSGYISKMTDDEITLIINNDTEVDIEKTIQRKDIIEMKQTRIYKDTYGMFGLSFGLPGGVNALWGYHFGKLGSRAELGFFPADELMIGVQANFSYNLYQNSIFETNVSVGTGYFYNDRHDFVYIGPFYDMNLYGFFLELGLGIGSGSYSSPQFMAQIGYVYRFN